MPLVARLLTKTTMPSTEIFSTQLTGSPTIYGETLELSTTTISPEMLANSKHATVESKEKTAGPLVLIAGGKCIPKPSTNSNPCGEDAFITSTYNEHSLIAVADGVGGWSVYGGDSSHISRGILDGLHQELISVHSIMNEKSSKTLTATTNSSSPKNNSQPTSIAPDGFAKAAVATSITNLIDKSFKGMIEKGGFQKGTTTVCAGLFNPNTGILEIGNIGDSTLAIFRRKKCVFQTKPGVFDFNSPLQIGFDHAGSPIGNPKTDSTLDTFRVEAGDVIVVATDGLFDNVFISEVEELVFALTWRMFKRIEKEKRNAGQAADWKVAIKERTEGVAMTLAWFARAKAQENLWKTPFSNEAIKAMRAPTNYTGGKLDDISVVVAIVENE